MAPTGYVGKPVAGGTAGSGAAGTGGARLRNPTCSRSLQVEPSIGEYSDIGCDLVYVIRFRVHNKSTKVQRVRFKPPENNVFRLVTQPHSIAPGLHQDIEVEFCTKDQKDYSDSFAVVTDEGALEVPLHAWFPRPSLHFSDEIDLGVIPVQHNASRTLTLTNTGKSPGQFSFKSEGMAVGLAVAPSSGTVPPGRSKDVQVNYFGSEVGLFVSVIQVVLRDQSTRQLKVTARVVDSKVGLATLDGVPIGAAGLDFGTVFYGQRKCVEVVLANNSPFSTSFTIHPPEQGDDGGEDASRPSTPPPPPIESSPVDGRIQKQQSQTVKFCFQPLHREGKTGFQSEQRKPEPMTWRQTFGVEIAETEQKMELVIAGRAVHTDVELSQYRFQFPDTPVNDYVDMITTATNNSELPVDVVFSKVAQFHVRPSVGRAAPMYRIPAQGDMNFVISFRPNQLGRFKRTIDVSLCGGIKVIPLAVQGCATKVGTKTALPAGMQKTADDFRKELKFHTEDGGRQASSAPDGQVLEQEGRAAAAAAATKKQYAWMTDTSDELAMLQMNDLEQRRQHTQLYNDYITQSRLNREHAVRFQRDMAQEKKDAEMMGDRYVDKTLVDIGMVPGEGLVPPEPTVPRRTGTSIWKGEAERATGESGDSRMLAKAMKFDENRPIKKKFKEDPAGLNERRECRLVLSPKDLAHVAYGPRLLDFGKVSVFSENTKSFCVQNTLQSHILVKIPVALREELKMSFPASQVIPPGQVAGFDIVFRSDTEQTFTQAMWFQLNENHKLKFLLHAEAIPIEVSLSQERMDFRFNDFVLDPTLTQNLTLTNHGNSEAEFKWQVDERETAFSFQPETGTIPPNGQRNVDITFTPQQSNESKCTAQLLIEGGNTRQLQLSGYVQEARCVFNTQKVDFGTVAVGSAVQKSVSIKSLGPSTTVYSLAQLPQGLTVSNMRNRLTVGQSQEIVMTLRPTQATPVQGTVTCYVRGMKQPLRLAVKADPKIPRVELNAPNTLDFGKVIVGTREYRDMQLVNVGSIPATLLLDLVDIPDFVLCHETHDPVESAAPPDDDENNAGGYMMIHRDATDDDDDDDDYEGDDISEEAIVQRRGFKYKIVVNERSTLKCSLRFNPTSVTQKPHTFPLMMSLAGIPVIEASQDLMQQVTAEALKPRLVLSHTSVEFGSRVVVKDGTSKVANSISVRLTNEVEAELPWCLVAPQDPTMDEIFRISPTSGTLAPGHTASVQISFFPAEVRAYAIKVGVHLDGNMARNYMDISVTGNGANPALTFDRRELIMPIVPLDVPSRASFQINNEGYDSLELRWRLPGASKWKEEGPLPISLSFPDGSLLGQHHSQVNVEVTCLAKKPVSFTASIDFTDDEDMIFSIPVSFMSDNCLLTAYPYIATHKPQEQGGAYTLAAESEKKPVMMKVTEEQDALQNPMTPRNAGQRSEARSYAGSGYDTDQTNTYKTVDKWNRKSYTKKNADRLRMWLNANVLQDPVDDLIPGFTANHGKALIELVEHLAGRPPPGALRADKVQNINRRDMTAAEYKQFEDCLSFLKGWGAMLVDVRPEYLLTYEGFQRITSPQRGWGGGCGASAPTVQNRSGERGKARLSERKFNHRQTQTLMGLIFQIIKVFVLSKVTWKGFRSMPQSPVMQQKAQEERWSNNTVDPSVVGSNLYSPAEAILLKWLTIHVQHYFPNSTRVMSFDELRDCRAFAAVLCAYIPTLETRLGLTSAGGGSGFIAQPTSVADCEKNASIVVESLKAYGMDLKVSAKELVESSVRDLLLITVNLFQALPQFIPQATILFTGRLQETITKTVELQNPHRWPIDYLVLLDDESGEFQIDKGDNKLRLESRASASLPIWIVPRFSKKCSARLTFLSMGRLGPNSASTIVFNVETNIDSQHALKTLNIESPLYEVTTHDLEFDNPFNERGTFTIQYHQQYIKENDAKGKPIVYGEEANSGSYQDAFWTAQDTVNVKKGEKAIITFQFIPFMRGKYTCRVVLVDEKVGEVIYLINANVTAPLAFERMAFQTELSATTAKEVTIPLKNAAQDKAMTILHNERFKGFKAKMKADTNKGGEAQSRYRVEYSSPFFTGPREISMDSKDDDPTKKKAMRGSALALNVNFQPKGPGVYPGRITLVSDGDVRVIEVEGKSRSPGLKADLNFECAARQHVSQELPVTNTTDKDWTIHATITGEYFTGPREITVKAGKVKNYVLNFSPQWMCDIKGSLVLKNVDSLEKFTYNLMAKVDEPLAEASIVAECVARDTTTITIKVPNITNDDVVYNVETDIPYARGTSQLTVPKQEVGRYNLVLKPILSGKSTGSITFTTPNEQYVWYVVQLQVARPPPERTINVRAVARDAVAAEINIGNPTDQELSFIVRRKGEGLFGENRIIVAPNGSSVYQLIYNPLRAGTGEGQLSFYHDDMGEHWYEVKMTADEAAPEVLPEVHCELGKATSIELAIENPVDHDLQLAVTVSNTQNFSVSPAGTLVLKPHQKARPVVTYMPSSIAQRQETTVVFSHPKLGKWEYIVRGKGSPPTLMEATVVHAIAGRSQQTSVMFRNPFPLPRRFLVTLRTPGGAEGADSPFALMLKRKTNTVSPFTSLTVPISYSPQIIAEHRGVVEVQVVGEGITDDLKWEYPIVGVAEALPVDNIFKFVSKCRSEHVQTLSLPLHQADLDLTNEKFTHEVVFPEGHPHLNALRSALVIQAAYDEPRVQGNTVKVEYIVTFTPLRTFTATVELLIRKKSGGLWRFELRFEALPPPADDTILLEAAMAQRSSVGFLLNNIFAEEQPFRAYFTSDSAAEFTVSPAKGVLPALTATQQTPTQFVISFASSQYGKTLVGTLVIEGDLVEWRYDVRGTLPRYRAPQVTSSKIENKLSKDAQDASRAAASRKVDWVKQNQGAYTTSPALSNKPLSSARAKQGMLK